MTIRVVTDSTCDLPQSEVDAYGITVIPCYVNMDNASYLDGVELSREKFYACLPDYNPPPTTSAPGIGTFVEKYNQLIAEGASAIISVHVSEKLSNVINVARLAAGRLAAESIATVPIHIIDSGQVSIGTGLLALDAMKAAIAGCNISDIVAALKEKTTRLHTAAALDTLEYLRRSGRATRFQALMGAMMSIKPLLTLHGGVVLMERVRTHQKAIRWLLQKLDEMHPFEQLVLLHTHATEEIEALWQAIHPHFPDLARPWCIDVTTILGAHLGPAGVGFTCVTAAENVQN